MTNTTNRKYVPKNRVPSAVDLQWGEYQKAKESSSLINCAGWAVVLAMVLGTFFIMTH